MLCLVLINLANHKPSRRPIKSSLRIACSDCCLFEFIHFMRNYIWKWKIFSDQFVHTQTETSTVISAGFVGVSSQKILLFICAAVWFHHFVQVLELQEMFTSFLRNLSPDDGWVNAFDNVSTISSKALSDSLNL